MTKESQLFDKINQPISLECCVAYPVSNSMGIGKVTKINPKMVRVDSLATKIGRSTLKYPTDLIVLDSTTVTMWLLQRG